MLGPGDLPARGRRIPDTIALRERRPFFRRVTAWSFACATVLAGAAAAGAAAAESPSLRLIAPDRTATGFTDGRTLLLPLELYVASDAADFEVELRRPGYGPWRLAQVDSATGERIRWLPPRLYAERDGFDRFLSVHFFDSRGRLVARDRSDFCPNSFDRQRVDATGPLSSRYPPFCSSGFPLARGMVWGIDRGWGAAAGLRRFRSAAKLPPGRYRVRVEIRERYLTELEIPRSAARAAFEVRIKKRVREPKPPDGSEPLERPQREPPEPAGTRAAPPSSALPDLVALPAWNIHTQGRGGKQLLGFATTTWNAGPGTLDVEGFRREHEDAMDAYQYFLDDAGRAVGSERVGSMDFDTRDGHRHWHFKQFVRYTLLDRGRRRVVRSRKQAFCIAPTDPVDLTMRNAAWLPATFSGPFGIGSVCGRPGSLWIRERLEVGWGDTYMQAVPGQAFDITDLPNGTYFIEVEVNPGGHLYEAKDSNNVKRRRIRLGGKPRSRTVTVAPWRGIEA